MSPYFRVRRFCFLLLPGFLLPSISPCMVGKAHGENPGAASYAKDRMSLQIVTGSLFSPVPWSDKSPVFQYVQCNVRLGWMATEPSNEVTLLRGNWEFLVGLSYSGIYKGFGSYLAGVDVLGRYNLVQPDSRVVPYLQMGVGAVYTDAYQDQTQIAIGQALEFTPQGSIGIRYHINPTWSFDVEGMFHHISNAGLNERNGGINAWGGFLGLTYSPDWHWLRP